MGDILARCELRKALRYCMRAWFWLMMRHGIVERRERLEARDWADFGGVDVLVRGGGFVRAAGSRGVVCARDGLLHRRSLPDCAASPQPEGAATAFAHGLRAGERREHGLLDVALPEFRNTPGDSAGICAAASSVGLRALFGGSCRRNRAFFR